MAATIEIKKRMLDLGLRNQDFADECDVSKQFISQLIKGLRRSRRLERYIARRLGWADRAGELFGPGPDQVAA